MMTYSRWSLVALLSVACGTAVHREDDAGTASPSVCAPMAMSETVCGDGVDEDCDRYTDCLDTECEGRSCSADPAFRCVAGGCLANTSLPELPAMVNLRPTVHGDTARVDFEAVIGARDYRIYPLPSEADVLVGERGEVVVRDGIYRCAGDRGRYRTDATDLDISISTTAGNVHGYVRTESDALLGYVFQSPGDGRQVVYRVANPRQRGGYRWPYDVPPGREFYGADYVLGEAARDALIAEGWRDDGPAFYVADGGTRAIYRREYDGESALFYAAGPEADARGREHERFRTLVAPAEGTVPLYRVFYASGASHDVLAAGEADRDRLRDQGNVPITSLTWSGLRGPTTLVIEALDQGCPYPGGYIGAFAHAATSLGAVENDRTITLDEARREGTRDVFVNGQHDPTNRPAPIARSFITVAPTAHPDMDWFESFDTFPALDVVYADGNQRLLMRSPHLGVELEVAGELANHSYGTVLGQFFGGSVAGSTLIARDANAQLSSERYLHVTMSVDVSSTGRRYPQIFISDIPADPPEFTREHGRGDAPLYVVRLGPRPFEMLPLTDDHTIVVQTFGANDQVQLQFCDGRGWAVTQHCPQANLHGAPAGQEPAEAGWDAPWLPNPVMGDRAGMDRLVKFDVYASTERVYVFVDDEPYGCALLPPGRMPAGPVSVAFGVAAYHIDIDGAVVPEGAPYEYWQRHHVAFTERRIDDLGVDSSVEIPAWNPHLTCGSRFHGGGLVVP